MENNPGQRIRELREARGWTQQELEFASGVNKATLHSWESSRNTMHYEWLKHRDAVSAIAVEKILKNIVRVLTNAFGGW